MNFSKPIYFSIFVLLVFSSLMSLAGIRGFHRLAPSLEIVNAKNTLSLYYTEQMLSAIANKASIETFEQILLSEKTNITEAGEAKKIEEIEGLYKRAFMGDPYAKKELLAAIVDLSQINRGAMEHAAFKTKKLSIAGSWVIAFMLLALWSLGILILNSLNKTVIEPLNEIDDLFVSVSKGNKFRRCPTLAPTKSFQKIYDGINELLDCCMGKK